MKYKQPYPYNSYEENKLTGKTHRTTSKSGASGESTRKKEPSKLKRNSSAPSTASFEKVFGQTPNPELNKLKAMEQRVQEKIRQLETVGEPRLALFRARHRAELGRQRRLLKDVQEAITAEGYKLPTA